MTANKNQKSIIKCTFCPYNILDALKTTEILTSVVDSKSKKEKETKVSIWFQPLKLQGCTYLWMADIMVNFFT